MYRDSLKAIEAKAEEITDKELAEILARAEGGYYSSAPEEAVSDRISQVIGDVQKRLESRLGRNDRGEIFAGIIQSVITGYWNEQTVIARKRRWEKLLPKEALRI